MAATDGPVVTSWSQRAYERRAGHSNENDHCVVRGARHHRCARNHPRMGDQDGETRASMARATVVTTARCSQDTRCHRTGYPVLYLVTGGRSEPPPAGGEA